MFEAQLDRNSYDNDGNLVQIDDLLDATRSQSFSYGLSGELLSETGSFGTKSYIYDQNINRVSRTFDDGTMIRTQNLTYATGSNRIATRNGNAATYDSSGNILFDGAGAKEYQYGPDGRLLSVTDSGIEIEENYYAGDGVRLIRESTSDTGAVKNRLFEYIGGGSMLAELKLAPNGARIERDIVWFNGLPIAQFRNRTRASGDFRDEQLVYLHTDHLGAPRIGTSVAGNIVWRWDSDVFGKGVATADPDGDGEKVFVKLRLPGQIADSSTGKRYNFFRGYDQGLGRYLQSDPIGLAGGPNTYVYANSNPASFSDPLGLVACSCVSKPGVRNAVGTKICEFTCQCQCPDKAGEVRSIVRGLHGFKGAVSGSAICLGQVERFVIEKREFPVGVYQSIRVLKFSFESFDIDTEQPVSGQSAENQLKEVLRIVVKNEAEEPCCDQ